jgi:hypothetical protein
VTEGEAGRFETLGFHLLTAEQEFNSGLADKQLHCEDWHLQNCWAAESFGK